MILLNFHTATGINTYDGHTSGNAVQPSWTLTLALPKHGFYPSRTGELFLGDIGIPSGVYHQMDINYGTPLVENPIARLFTHSLMNTEE